MILVIRGHIRNTFETSYLYNLVKNIYSIDPSLKIFIHTWNIFANNISHRQINKNINIVTKDIIYNYFNDLKILIDDIIIDDDSSIQLIGNLQGNINNGPMPLIGWKNYWYGKFKIIEHINNKNINNTELIINTRFDLLNCDTNSLLHNQAINFIKNNICRKITKNIFFKDGEIYGVDNIYIGTIDTMYKLSHYFCHFLDDILMKHNNTVHQEFLVYRINNILFD